MKTSMLRLLRRSSTSRGLKFRLCCTLCCIAAAEGVFADSYSITVPGGGYALIANQLDNGSNTLAAVFGAVPGGTTAANAGTQLLEWNCQAQAFSTYYYKTNGIGGVGWRSTTSGSINVGTNSFAPGQAAILYNQTSTNYTFTLTGTPNVPVLPISFNCGSSNYYLLASQTNAPAAYEDITGSSPQEGTQLFRYSSGSPTSPFPPQTPNYIVYSYSGGAWTPSAPVANVGESVWIYPSGSTSSSLVYQGLTNTSLGSAALVLSSNQLIVSNIGTTGQDGVNITVPSGILGVGILWLPLDPGDALPVGAYLQEQIIGTAGAVTNGTVATFTTTKAGTSNYVMTADFTPIGESNLLVQAYNGTILVGQTNLTGGPLFSLSTSSALPDDWEWDNKKMMMTHTWWKPPPLPFPFLGANILTVTPLDFNWGKTTNYSATAITASGISSITITGEPASLVYQGLTNTSLGSAALSEACQCCGQTDCPCCGGSSNSLTIGNIGTTGQDGVNISLSPGNSFVGEWLDLDPSNALPVGAYVQNGIIGTAGAVTNGLLGSTKVTKAGTSNYVVTADFSPLGTSNYTVQVYNGPTLVGQGTVQNGSTCATLPKIPIQPTVTLRCCPLKAGPDWGFADPVNIAISGGPTVMGTEILVEPLGFNWGTTTNFGVAITASGISSITFTDENAYLVYQGLTNTSLGSATLSVNSNFNQLTIGNIGTNGQDGVNYTLDGVYSIDGAWLNLDPSNALPVGAYVQSGIIGTAGAVTNGYLGSTTVTKAGTGDYVITADFSPLGSSTRTVQVWDGPNLVAQVNGQAGSVCAESVDIPLTVSLVILPWPPHMDWDWDSDTSISISGGPAVMGTEILMIPEGAAPSGFVSAGQILAAGIPSITITNDSVSYAPTLAINSMIFWGNCQTCNHTNPTSVLLNWTTDGFTNVVQATTNTTGGYSPSNFVDLATIVVTTRTTNYVVEGPIMPAQFYRISRPLP